MTENLARASVSGQYLTRLSILRKLLTGLAQYLGTSYQDNDSTSPARMHKVLRRGDKLDHSGDKECSHDSNILPMDLAKVLLRRQDNGHDECEGGRPKQVSILSHVAGGPVILSTSTKSSC